MNPWLLNSGIALLTIGAATVETTLGAVAFFAGPSLILLSIVLACCKNARVAVLVGACVGFAASQAYAGTPYTYHIQIWDSAGAPSNTSDAPGGWQVFTWPTGYTFMGEQYTYNESTQVLTRALSGGGTATASMATWTVNPDITDRQFAYSANWVHAPPYYVTWVPIGSNRWAFMYREGDEMNPLAFSVTGISPSSGGIAGGQLVTVTGTGFTSDTYIKIDGNLLREKQFVSSTTIKGRTPPHAAGAFTVRAEKGTDYYNLASAYTYVTVETAISATYVYHAGFWAWPNGKPDISDSWEPRFRLDDARFFTTNGEGLKYADLPLLKETVNPGPWTTGQNIPLSVLDRAGHTWSGTLTFPGLPSWAKTGQDNRTVWHLHNGATTPSITVEVDFFAWKTTDNPLTDTPTKFTTVTVRLGSQDAANAATQPAETPGPGSSTTQPYNPDIPATQPLQGNPGDPNGQPPNEGKLPEFALTLQAATQPYHSGMPFEIDWQRWRNLHWPDRDVYEPADSDAYIEFSAPGWKVPATTWLAGWTFGGHTFRIPLDPWISIRSYVFAAAIVLVNLIGARAVWKEVERK